MLAIATINDSNGINTTGVIENTFGVFEISFGLFEISFGVSAFYESRTSELKVKSGPLEYLDSVDEAQFHAVGGDVREADGVVVGGGLADVSQREAHTLSPTVENRHELHQK